jgi:protein-disulfide isomerase
VPTPPPSAGRARRQASPRVLAIAGAVVVAVVIAVVLGVVLSGGGKKSATSTLPAQGSLVDALPGASDVNAEFKGIRQNGMFLGAAGAPVTMIEYIDLQCPYCQQFETEVMPDIVAKYVRTGKLKVEARTLAFIGPDSIRGRDAMFAASLQNHAFDFAQLLYDNQQTENTGWLNDAMVDRAASSIPGVNPRELVAASSSDQVKALGVRIDGQAKADGVNSTPSLLVGKAGETPQPVRMKNATDAKTLKAAIEAALS